MNQTIAPPTEITRRMWDAATKDNKRRHKNGRRFLRFKTTSKNATKWTEVFWRS
jgi:hypothetical protein